jgi:hypothetical protein
MTETETTEPTITVEGYLGRDKQVTKEYFVKQWTSHVNEIKWLDFSMEWQLRCEKIKDEIAAKAESEFERLLKVQEK